MNKKLIKASLAGAAVIALAAAGGSTFAAYSDFTTVTGNDAGAGTLTLGMGPNAGQNLVFDHIKMAPQQINQERQVYVTSNNAQSTPDGRLFMKITNLKGTEDGCDGNGEKAVDSACTTPATSEGQFIKDATVTITSYKPTTPGVCNQLYAPGGSAVTGQHGGSLSDLATQTAATAYELTGNGTTLNGGGVDMSVLHPGDGLCVSITIGLASGVSNASQGDSASFDVEFDLKQALANGQV